MIWLDEVTEDQLPRGGNQSEVGSTVTDSKHFVVCSCSAECGEGPGHTCKSPAHPISIELKTPSNGIIGTLPRLPLLDVKRKCAQEYFTTGGGGAYNRAESSEVASPQDIVTVFVSPLGQRFK